ncbi:MAG: FAD binding domain-containing protein [Xenococcaceae cyanobacterium MO_188.B19]|nr:FAD binding domain-containing protein [Xenococcaceae cyanobacterium MO_188.B19]
MTGQIHFILNDRTICTSQPTGVTVLDYLRLSERLTGTKEGCKEGGCGACTVLVGELQGEKLVYKTVLSCLLPLGELSGKHLVTIEGLNQAKLSPIQQALVDYGATQCGFCTPGIVMSLTGYLLGEATDINEVGIKTALDNNLCRCTGYGAIKRAGSALVQSLGKEEVHNLETWIDKGIIPEYFRHIRDRLQQLPQSISASENGKVSPEFTIAGGTDLYVQQGDILANSKVRLLNRSPQMKGIKTEGNSIHIGALTTFADFANHPAIIKLIPQIQTYIQRIASHTIRQRATVGGNIITASPIGDVSVMLLAFNADLVLQEGDNARKVPLREFFQGYKKIEKQADEILTEIIIGIPAVATQFNFEKISKRQYLDCSAVNSAIFLNYDGDVIARISIAMGGVAPIPLFLKQTSNYFLGKRVTPETITGAFPILQQEISPISDIHGSANYKRLLARQVLIAHFTELFSEFINLKDFYATN